MSSTDPVRRYSRVGLPNGMLVAWKHMGIRRVSRVGTVAVGGIFINTPHPLPVGEVIHLIFEIPEGEVRARATVRDSRPGKGMGVQFNAMGTDAHARLQRLMKILTRI